jgi:hypothetical protein
MYIGTYISETILRAKFVFILTEWFQPVDLPPFRRVSTIEILELHRTNMLAQILQIFWGKEHLETIGRSPP